MALTHKERQHFDGLDMWMSGWGDGEYLKQAQTAESLFCQGKQLPEGKLPDLRAIAVAKEKGYKCTLRAIGQVMGDKLASEASALMPGLEACEAQHRVIEQHENYTFTGCMSLYDGTLSYDGNHTFFWPNGAVKALGYSNGWGAHGRWLYFSEEGEEVGSSDNYKGAVIAKTGQQHELDFPTLRRNYDEDIKLF